ncbi:MAG TPA: FAD-dependent monooxygenase [Burkholderiales bacterium]|nr:FAD-dependent monooxygenase [Burkholderiales bacterium]
MGSPDYDIAIIGGGPVGAAVAVALRDTGLSAVVLEARSRPAASGDARTLAMSYGSRLILERLGAWQRLETPTPITSIHVSQRGGFGRTMLEAAEAGVPALGYVVRYAALQQAVGAALADTPARLVAATRVTALESAHDRVVVACAGDAGTASFTARLAIIADGGGHGLGAPMKAVDYGQAAVVGLVACSRPHGHRAYERFTPDGPAALLPHGNRYALVWTAAPERARQLLAAGPEQFLQELQRHFGDRAGRFESVEARASFALALRYVEDPVLPRAVMLGNAAQALHPIAGQGFNLGLRDAWELAGILCRREVSDPGAPAVLARYAGARRADRMHGIALTHSLVRIFSSDAAPLRALRGAALSLLDTSPRAKRTFMQAMMFGASG